jgi:hypothetical protein
MNKQDKIINNQKEIIEKLNSHDKKFDLLSHDNVEVKTKSPNKKKTKEGFSVSICSKLVYLVIHVIHVRTVHIY